MHNRFFSTVFGILVIGVLFVACELTTAEQNLKTAIEDAEELYEGAVEGFDKGEYPGKALKALNDAISKARWTLNLVPADHEKELQKKDPKAKYTDEDYKKASELAKADLDRAVITFKAEKNTYTIDTREEQVLRNAIETAQALHDGAEEGTDSGKYATGSKATLETAIVAAQKVVDDTDHTADGASKLYEEATTTLNKAIETFEAAKVE